MDPSGLFLCLLMVTSTTGGKSETSSSPCLHLDEDSYKVIEGESFYYIPSEMEDPNLPDENITWYKNGSEIKEITTDETHRIHYHGGALLFLNISANDSGYYTARHITPSDECVYYHLKIEVFGETSRENTTYEPIENSAQNQYVHCTDLIKNTCKTFNGNFTWLKGNNVLPGHHEKNMMIYEVQKKDEGIYTCICTWTHNQRVYNSSGSMRLFVSERSAYRTVEIISPTVTEQWVDKGSNIKLNCTVFCGTNAPLSCEARWLINGIQARKMDGYHETTKLKIENPTKSTFFTAILTIPRVSEQDFHRKFQCSSTGLYSAKSTAVTLTQRESTIPLIISGACVVLVALFAAVLIKYFAIDLALLFRPYFPPGRHNQDSKVYDAYVVYQTQSFDKETEEKLSTFVTKTLPSVLENKCGYRLFIQGRDDMPGEDRVELVERCIKQSRRLMVVLTPGTGSERMENTSSDQSSVIGGFDWQVGLHHALVQREITVILIELGETRSQGYTHLPPGLQHLIRKSPPIKWPAGSQKGSSWNSRFWKRVRYLMPVRPAKKCHPSTIV